MKKLAISVVAICLTVINLAIFLAPPITAQVPVGGGGGGSAVTITGSALTTLEAIKTAVEGTLAVNITQVGGNTPLAASKSGTLQNAVTATGNGSEFSIDGYPVVVFTVTCTSCAGSDIVTLEATENDSNWEPIANAIRVDAPGVYPTSGITLAGVTTWYAPVAGFQKVRAPVTRSAGTITVTARAILSPGLSVTTGGCIPQSIISANTVNETAIKASSGQLMSLNVTNIGANEVFFKLYNDTTANIDETDTPIQRYVIPGDAAGAGNHPISIPVGGMNFDTAITFRVTTGAADNDTGAVAASEVLISWCYK
jgi:hypothetical protein